MILKESPLAGAYVVEPERLSDARGWFARTFCASEFRAKGLDANVAQCSTSFNARRGTLRGLHYQIDDHAESKLVRCTRGSVFDVIVDLRPRSPSYLGWFGVELSESNGHALYIPEGLAHGFITLTDETEVSYQISAEYVPRAARGARWDDPAFAITWPSEPVVISDRDRCYPDFRP